MKAASVQRIVNAVADWFQIRHTSGSVLNETTALRLRVEALEALLEHFGEVMLEGTSADPASKKGK